MDTVQLSLHNITFASRLERELQQVANWQVLTVKAPDLNGKGLVILDEDTLDGLPMPLREPERFLLVTRNEGPKLKRAWEQGILSVVFEHDPPHTICLAAQAAMLRLQTPPKGAARCVISPKPTAVGSIIGRTAAPSVVRESAAMKNQPV